MYKHIFIFIFSNTVLDTLSTTLSIIKWKLFVIKINLKENIFCSRHTKFKSWFTFRGLILNHLKTTVRKTSKTANFFFNFFLKSLDLIRREAFFFCFFVFSTNFFEKIKSISNFFLLFLLLKKRRTKDIAKYSEFFSYFFKKIFACFTFELCEKEKFKILWILK